MLAIQSRSASSADLCGSLACEDSDQALEGEGLGVEQQFFLGGEVDGDGARGDVGPVGDRVDRGLAIAALGEQLERGVLDREAGALPLALAPIELFVHRQ